MKRNFFNSVIIALIVIVLLPLAAASSQDAAKITGHVTIAKQVTSTQTWLQAPDLQPIPPEYQFWIIEVDVKNNSYSLAISPSWPSISYAWVIMNDAPSYPKESYPIYCLAVQALSKDQWLEEGESGQFMVLYAIPRVKNFSDIHLVYTGSLQSEPDTFASLILDTVVSDYNWDTKTITDPNYKPPKGFPTTLVLAIVIGALLFAAPPVYIRIRHMRRHAQVMKEQQDLSEEELRILKSHSTPTMEVTPAGPMRIPQEIGEEGHQPQSPQQTYEVHIQESIVKNIWILESGLKVIEQKKKIYKGNKIIGEIDVLCRDMNGDFVVVELKRDIAKREVASQIAVYLGWVKENLPTGKEPRGIIVAKEIDDQLAYAISTSKFEIQTKRFGDLPPLARNMRHCDKCGQLLMVS